MNEAYLKVTLVQSTPAAEELVASAAKLCYASDTSTILTQEPEKAGQFVQQLRSLGHMSPLEHASFTFYIEGISRAASHQLVRHRIASYSQRSQRYVDHDNFEYITPPSLQNKMVSIDGEKIDATLYYQKAMTDIAHRYAKLVQALGTTGETSNQDARYILPNACETKIFVTMNARALSNFFEERLCKRAQWEIRAMAQQMLILAKTECPSIFAGVGPKCIRLKRCPEGKKTCGEFTHMKQRYS